MTHVINCYFKDSVVLYAVIAYMLDAFVNLIYVVSNLEISFFGTLYLNVLLTRHMLSMFVYVVSLSV